MSAFLAPTPLPSGTRTLRACTTPLTRRPRGQPRRARVSMWSMDDLPEPLRLPDRPRIGFSSYSEKLNGRLAMIGFVAAVLIELATGQGLVPIVTSLLSN